MAPAGVAFLWHMHQPYYKDPLTGEYLMPWVRLHATKGYFDMISILEDFTSVRQTFNLVPSLLDQLEDYAAGTAKDHALELSLKPAGELLPDEKKYLLVNFFMANWDNLVLPRPRFRELLQRRGMKPTPKDLDRAAAEFSAQDFLDLQALFNLAWFGYRARKKHPFLDELERKGKGFTEEEKRELLNIQRAVVGGIVPAYRAALDRGQIDVTFSPYYHPILPLLCDTDIAKRAMPGASLPPRFSHPEDARAQVRKAGELYRKLFGRNMTGMWPSEGSVAPEMVPIWAEEGIKWVATDEEILLHSAQIKDKGKGLYHPYLAEHGGRSVQILFRDRGLSDSIGFTYAKNDPVASAEDFVNHLQAIAKHNEGEKTPPLIAVILDGENPWEYYRDGGEGFLSRLYGKLSGEKGLETVKAGEFLEKYPAKQKLPHLHSGSWIGHNFDIWIGDPEENQAWDYLRRTRNFLCDHAARHPQTPVEKLNAAWEEIYRAEGSDWFWWYGEDFVTAHDEEFDRLFRTHLGNVYRLMERPVPEYIHNPIQGFKSVKISEKPVGLIRPVIDGISTDFYEWHEAGIFQMKKGSAMHQSEALFEAVHYGFDSERLFLRLDPSPRLRDKIPEGTFVRIHLLRRQSREFLLEFPLKFGDGLKSFALCRVENEEPSQKLRDYDTIKALKIVELALPLADIGFKPGEELDFYLQVMENHFHLERYPRAGYISAAVPGKDYEKEMWNA